MTTVWIVRAKLLRAEVSAKTPYRNKPAGIRRPAQLYVRWKRYAAAVFRIFVSWLIVRTTRKMVKATMRKSMIVLMKKP